MSATVALATAFFVDHRVTAALRTEVAGNVQVAQAEGWCIMPVFEAIAIFRISVRVTRVRRLARFLICFQCLHVLFQRTGNGIG